MATVKMGPLVTSARGKIGGVVFRSGRVGATVSALPAGRKNNTPSQVTAQAAIAFCARAWAALSDKEKKSWATYATPSAPPGMVFVPQMGLGRAAFFRWRSALYFCNQTPAYNWPRSSPVDLQNTAMVYNKRTPPTMIAVVTTNTSAAPLCALWFARRASRLATPTRPNWSLVTAPLVGDVQGWSFHPSYYPGGYGLDIRSLLAARVPGWNASQEWVYRLRICVGSDVVQFVDMGYWDSGVL
jgi:hypothetical protein